MKKHYGVKTGIPIRFDCGCIVRLPSGIITPCNTPNCLGVEEKQ